MAKLKLICLVKKRPEFTKEEFEKRWIEGHTPFGASWKNVKSYRVLFPEPDIHDKQGEPFEYDGIGEMIWDSYEDMIEDYESERGKAGFADADEFMAGLVNMYCTEHIIK
jgi:uncharacterized protein (TIGR02118 family)